MISQLSELVRSQRTFISHAAHELRSPLATLLGELQLALRRPREAEAYRAQVVNQAEGESSRFGSVLGEYRKAPEVTRKRLYLETMSDVLGGVNKIIIDEGTNGQGVVPYLPLDVLKPQAAAGATKQ